MDALILSSAISVQGLRGSKIGDATEMPRSDAKRFIANVKEAYRKLDRLKTGHQLLNAINSSGRYCVIFCAADAGAALPNPPTLSNNVARMMRSFRRQHHNMISLSKKTEIQRRMVDTDQGRVEQQSTVKSKAIVGMKTLLEAQPVPKSRADAAQELDVVLARAWGSVTAGRRSLAQLLGKSGDQIEAICDGSIALTDTEYFKIATAYYEHMTPGPGCSTQVKVQMNVAVGNPMSADNPKAYPFRPKQDRDCVAAEIMLGHELIHAWRMMTGRRLVNDGWEEEAMTCGLAPYANLRFTENALRRDGGFPARLTYPLPVFNSAWTRELALEAAG